jgi:hypothetical protein
VLANGGRNTTGTGNGVGLIANGGSNLSVTTSPGADAIQANGGEGKQAAGGNGVDTRAVPDRAARA